MIQENVEKKTPSYVWECAKTGLTIGVIAGIGLKCLDTFIGLLQADVLTAILFLVAIGVCFIPKIGFVITIIMAIVLSRITGLNMFLVVIGAGLTGAILGALPGMAIGGIVGLIRRQSHSPEGAAESGAVAIPTVILPLLGGTGLLVLYFTVVNPWLASTLT